MPARCIPRSSSSDVLPGEQTTMADTVDLGVHPQGKPAALSPPAPQSIPTLNELLNETIQDPHQGQAGQPEAPASALPATSVYAGYEADQQARSSRGASTSPIPTEGHMANGGEHDAWYRYTGTRGDSVNGAHADSSSSGNAQRAAPDGRTSVLENLVTQLTNASIQQSKLLDRLWGGSVDGPPAYSSTPMTMFQALNAGSSAGA